MNHSKKVDLFCCTGPLRKRHRKCTCECHEVPKSLCCHLLIDNSTQLVPPALEGSIEVQSDLTAEIIKVCDGVVIICGLVTKRIIYNALSEGIIIPNHVVIDEVPFTCLIDSVNIKSSDKYKISDLSIVCEVVAQEANFARDETLGKEIAFRFVQKDVIKVCIREIY